VSVVSVVSGLSTMSFSVTVLLSSYGGVEGSGLPLKRGQ